MSAEDEDDATVANKFAVRTIDEFLDLSDAKETSKRQYRTELLSMERMMGKPLFEASQRDVIALGKQLRKMSAGPQYAKIAKMLYRKARRKDLVELLALKQRTKKLKPADLLTPKDVQAMVDAAESMRDKCLVACLWECGVRVSELLSLDLGDVKVRASPANGGRKIYVFWFGQVKETGEEHEGYVIEAAPVLEKWLKAYPFERTPNAPLFPSYKGKRLLRRDSLNVVKRLASRAGLEKRVYNHLFRHSRATWALASGMTDAQVKVLYGWAPGSTMLSRYSHLTSKQAYGGLLRSLGLEAEKVEVERLSFDDEDLKPVVPMVVPRGAKRAESSTLNMEPWPSLVGVDPDTFERFAKTVAKYQVEILRSQPAPAWSIPDEILKLKRQIGELRAQLADKGATS